MGVEAHTPQRVIRLDDGLWEEFGRAVGNRNRSRVIRQMIAWYLRRPGAELPEPGTFTPPAAGTDAIAIAPVPHALYRFTSHSGVLLYVGITMDLPVRLREHRRLKPWWSQVARIDVEHFNSRSAALAAEEAAIKAERPLYNVVHNRVASPLLAGEA